MEIETSIVHKEPVPIYLYIVANEGGEIIPMFANVVEVGTKKTKIENPAGKWEFDGNRGPERWWFES